MYRQKTNLVFLFTITVLLPFVFLTETNLYFNSNGFGNVSWNSNLLFNFISRSKLDCMKNCGTYPSCHTVTYGSTTKNCKGFDRNMSEISTSTNKYELKVYFAPERPQPDILIEGGE